MASVTFGSQRGAVLTGSVENASINCDVKGTGNGMSGFSCTLVDVAMTEQNGVSMYGGNTSGNNSISLKGSARFAVGGLTMESSAASRPVTLSVADNSLLNASGSLSMHGPGVFNVRLSGSAPKLRTVKLGENSSANRLTGSLNIEYDIPSQIAATGYADAPIRITSASAASALGYFSNTESPGVVNIGVAAFSGALSNVHPAVDFTLAEACAGMVTNNIVLAEGVGKVVFDWSWGYGWDAEQGKSLLLAEPETEGELPTALSLRLYRPGTLISIL